MAVLNPPQALPGVAYAIVKFLHRVGGSVPRSRMLAALYPTGGAEDQGNLRDTVSALRALELVSDNGGYLQITERLGRRLGESMTRPEFDAIMRREIHAVDRDGDPWTDASAIGGRDAGRALSWFLAQPALGPALAFDGPPERSADIRQRADLKGYEILAFENVERFRPFLRWAVALGFASPVKVMTGGGKATTLHEPVPTAALAAEIERIGARRVAITDLLNDLRTAMPYLPGGTTGLRLQDRMRAPIDPAALKGRLHSSLGEGLLTLESLGTISLSGLADAEGVIIDNGIEGRRVTHVAINAEVAR